MLQSYLPNAPSSWTLEALGVASEEVAAEEKQAASALARALGHNQVADGVGNLHSDTTCQSYTAFFHQTLSRLTSYSRSTRCTRHFSLSGVGVELPFPPTEIK